MNIFSELETEYNYTHNELLMAKYVLTCIVYEASKIFLLTIIFYFLHRLDVFAISFIFLFILSTNGGGLHFNNYFMCFISTLFLFLMTTMILPDLVTVSYGFIVVSSFIFIHALLKVGPIASPLRPKANEKTIIQCKIISVSVIIFFIILAGIFNLMEIGNLYIQVIYQTILLHVFQLVVAKILRKRGLY